MTRTILLSFAVIGLAPAVLLALANLVTRISAIVYRPLSLSVRLYRPGGGTVDFAPALQLSATTALLILLGAVLILAGIACIRPEVPARPLPLPPPASSPQ
jgi:hypothetical protein